MNKLSRRDLLIAGTGLVVSGCAHRLEGRSGGESKATMKSDAIDRQAVVRRHNPEVRKLDPFSALSVGNGRFAFTADFTGLQTFDDAYQTDFPLCTAADWGWHTTPKPAAIQGQAYRFKQYNAHGRQVGYATDGHGQEALFDWLRQNPHRFHLGRIGLSMKRSDGTVATVDDVTGIQQTFDLWAGIIDSRFMVAGRAVRVTTCCHPELDALAFRIESPLVADGSLKLLISFPFPSSSPAMADWNHPDKHETNCVIGKRADFARQIDDDKYSTVLEWKNGRFEQTGKHDFVLGGDGGSILEGVILFSKESHSEALPSFDQTAAASRATWNDFWSTGAAIDFGACTDPRAAELERRVVLSQYNTALHCAGPMPPAETGLLFNSWYGKSHLEMHWWHGVHFSLWNRFDLLNRSLDFYERIMPVGRATAQRQGYAGVRWPKMVGPDGADSPSPIAPLLIWQQPHPIYYAELCYRQNPSHETLERWKQIVFESADFMASYAALEGDRYVLGPPLKSVPEHTDGTATKNPAFELEYWRFGLTTAQLWRKRLGLAPDPKWAEVLARLSPLPTDAGLYLMMEGQTDVFTKWNWEHPSVLGCLGVLDGDGVDREMMRATLKKVMAVWEWDKCWGWDFPMTAMTAARLGEGEIAVQALLIDSPKNRYHPNGHVYQRPGLTAYLPANGGLLTAVAMMATLPGGFPSDGKWQVKSEGLTTPL